MVFVSLIVSLNIFEFLSFFFITVLCMNIFSRVFNEYLRYLNCFTNWEYITLFCFLCLQEIYYLNLASRDQFPILEDLLCFIIFIFDVFYIYVPRKS